jgi:hypothetical protein
VYGIFYSGRAYVQFLIRLYKVIPSKNKFILKIEKKISTHERNVLLVMITRIAITKTTIVVS